MRQGSGYRGARGSHPGTAVAPDLLSNPFPSRREAAPFLLSQGHRRLFAESRSRGLFSLSHAVSCHGLIPWAKVLASGGTEAATPWGPARTG